METRKRAVPVGRRRMNSIERATGQRIAAAWVVTGQGGWLSFATGDHRHGYYQPRTQSFTWAADAVHYRACEDLWPA